MELSCQVGTVLGAHSKLAMVPPSALRVAGMVKATGMRHGVARPLRMVVRASASEVKGVAAQDSKVSGTVRGVLFDMDGVLCDSEHCSRLAAVELFKEMGFTVTEEDFIPFMGTGEANFLGGVAKKYGVKDFDVTAAKKRFMQIYVAKFATPNSGIGFPGALELVKQCKEAGLKTAVASSADRVKVDANLAAAGFPQENFDSIISADLFENLKPAPDIFLAAAKSLGLQPSECVVIEDAYAGVQAAKAARMRCISVTTTLSEEKLMEVGPELVRSDISKISLKDIQELGVSS